MVLQAFYGQCKPGKYRTWEVHYDPTWQVKTSTRVCNRLPHFNTCFSCEWLSWGIVFWKPVVAVLLRVTLLLCPCVSHYMVRSQSGEFLKLAQSNRGNGNVVRMSPSPRVSSK